MKMLWKTERWNTISCEFIFFSAHSEMKCSRTIAAIQRCLYTKLRNVSFQQLSQLEQSSKYTFISGSARGRIRCSRTIVATQKDVCTQNHAMSRFNRRFKLPQQNTLQQHPASNVKNNKSVVPRQFLTKMFLWYSKHQSFNEVNKKHNRSPLFFFFSFVFFSWTEHDWK